MKRPILLAIALVAALVISLVGTGCSDGASITTTTQSTSTQPAPSISETTSLAAGYVTVTVNETFDRLSSVDSGAQIVDIREPYEWAATGVPVGAVLIPLGELKESALSELAQDRPVYVICNSGNRSREGSQILIDLGYPEVFNVGGGIQAWLAAGLPVQSP